jgi:hypothetical protein
MTTKPPHGYVNSSPPDLSLPGTLTNGALQTFLPLIWTDTRNAIFSRALPDGFSPFNSPDGLPIDLCGPEVVPVSRLAVQQEGGAMAYPMKNTCGQNSSGSSVPPALLSSLVSKFQTLCPDWMKSVMIWKTKTTPSGRCLYRLTVPERTMKENGFTLRHTPTCTANQAAPSMQKWPCCRGLVVTPDEWRRRMGYPQEWLSVGLETPSSRKSPPNSSSPVSI